ncbi:MAG: hydroxymethylglutaryl-CoA lyase [Flavobacteriaceae bacterium]|nr:hydroxymethylglutaryl-CoA lyase [Flavobacteriaceae bacterium]|tara:strand:+ start:1890 stop:2753 length:864 start_codon:yes stop_codon:yes gene_type:complete
MVTPKIVECPRDAMQGIQSFIPTTEKVNYLQFLLQVGFHSLDFGSFVSARAVPQMRDTAHVLDQLDLSKTKTKLLAIVANLRGAETALNFEQIEYIGFPFSISENFQMRNTHKTISESLKSLQQIKELTDKSNKTLVLYLSMGFGNPYGDPWSVEVVSQWVERLAQMEIEIISLSDTVGQAASEDISFLYTTLIPAFSSIEFGAHFHTHPNKGYEKLKAAFDAGCRRFDGAIYGFGGCPMASDALVGNMPTEKVITFLNERGIDTGLSMTSFESAFNKTKKLFSKYS